MDALCSAVLWEAESAWREAIVADAVEVEAQSHQELHLLHIARHDGCGCDVCVVVE